VKAGLGAAAPKSPIVPGKAAAPVAAKPLAAKPAPDLFGSAAKAGAEEETGAAKLAAKEAPAVPKDNSTTGARNESSVLFSLDALKAGMTAAKKEEPAAEIPRAGFDNLMSMGGGSVGQGALLTMDPKELLKAPPPPPREEPRAAAAAASPTLQMEPSPTTTGKGKLMLILGGLALVGVSLAAGLMLGGGGDKSATGSATATAATPVGQSAGAEQPSAPIAENTPVATAAPATSAATPPAATAAVPVGTPAVPVAGVTPKPGPGPAPGPNTKPTPKPAEPAPVAPAPATGGAAFDKGAAVAALQTAASASSSCKRPDGPMGSGKALVTFAPSGRVTNVTLSGGSFAGTPVGGCIARVFRSAKVPPFGGDAVTVSKGFSIVP
jgi:hypothetical protein